MQKRFLIFWISISRGDIMRDMPYFMTDESWYAFDFEKRRFVLTDKAPEKAKESYAEYLKQKDD